MSKPFDADFKEMLDRFAAEWVRLLAPRVGLPVGPLTPIDGDLSVVQPAADKVFRIGPPGHGLLHLEVQADWDGSLADRLLTYNVLLHDRHGGPVRSLVLLLRRDANSPRLTGELVRTDAAGAEYLRFRYTVVRVWQLAADELFALGPWAGPMALLTDDARPRLPELIRQFGRQVAAEEPDPAMQARLLSSAHLLLGMRYNTGDFEEVFMSLQSVLEQSSSYQKLIQRGAALGELQQARRTLIRLLTDRFGAVPPELEARIQATNELARLDDATSQVLRIARIEELTL